MKVGSTKYRLYVDESGNSDLESSENPNHRFLSLTGVIIELEHILKRIHPEMEKLKVDFFHPHPDEPIVLHRSEMINGEFPFESLKNPEVRSRFDRSLLSLLRSWEFTVITVCIDKKKHKDQYSAWRYDPYHYCLAVLLERYVLFLKRHHSRGDVPAESRGGKEDRRLKESFERLFSTGTEYIDQADFAATLTSKQLKVKPKANNITGIQIANMLANPSRNEVLRDHGLMSRAIGAFGLQIITILQEKYDQVDGRYYGKKLL